VSRAATSQLLFARTFNAGLGRVPRCLACACHAWAGPLVGFVLAILLVSTTPVGTGGGVHQFTLVHPLFSHLHVYAGQILTHEQLEQAVVATASGEARPRLPGPALGAGSAGVTIDAGLAQSPVLPASLVATLPSAPTRSLDVDDTAPRGRTEAPPDPPPTA
jgi:hypothetical protein